MNAVILSTGDELVLGQIADTNSSWLSAQLAANSVATLYHKTVGDDLDAIVAIIREASNAADLVILTGGLGPTEDDLTREALAVVLGTPLDIHEPSMKRIEAFFRKIGRPCTATNMKQALCPRGSKMLDNEWGTAPGIEAAIGHARLFAFPGVPYEMKNMFARYVLPVVTDQAGRTILTESLQVFGAGESTLAERLGDMMKRDRNPLVGTTASGGMVTVRIRSDFPSREQAEHELAGTAAEVEKRLGKLLTGRGEINLAFIIGDLLRSRAGTVATAESCTGGLVGKLLTDIPGSSAWYRGGWVVYSNELKSSQLGVPAELIAEHGAVSKEVARAMATGALSQSCADYALAITGIAGPDGGTAEKPVGTVWIAVARKAPAPTVAAERFQFPGERGAVRDRAAKTALNMLRKELITE